MHSDANPDQMDVQEADNLTITDLSKYENEEFCFECKGIGTVVCCDRCPKTFHEECFKTCKYENLLSSQAEIEDSWVCPCCQLSNICPICSKTVQEPLNDSPICTICYRHVHKQCLSYKSDLSKYCDSSPSLLIVCFQCFRLGGIQSSSDRKISLNGTYRSVKPFKSSYIHKGWLSQKEYEIILKLSQSKSKDKKLALKEHSHSFQKLCRIDKILMMRPPNQLRQCSISDQCQLLLSKEKEGGFFRCESNYFFLVKWTGQSANEATWEDEFLVRRYGWNQVLSYLYWRQTDQGVITKKQLKAKLKDIYPINMCSAIVPNLFKESITTRHCFHKITDPQRDIEIVSLFLTNIYQNSNLPRSTLLITRRPNVWQEKIKATRPPIRIVALSESANAKEFQMSCEVLLPRQKKPFFDVLLASCKSILQQQTLFKLSYDIMVFDEDVAQQLTPEFYAMSEKSLRVILYTGAFPEFIDRASVNKKPSLSELFLRQSAAPVVDLVPTKSVSENRKVQPAVVTPKISQVKKLHFLRFALSIGFDFPTFQTLYDRLRNFERDKQIYDGSKEQQASIKHHLQMFLEGLAGKAETDQQLFHNWKTPTITHRIASLAFFRRAYNQLKNKPETFPFPSKFVFATKNGRPIYSSLWRAEDDLQLMRLIIEHGHTKWHLICQGFNTNDDAKPQKGYLYLRNAIWPGLNMVDKWKNMLATCIKIRSNYLVGHEEFERYAT